MHKSYCSTFSINCGIHKRNKISKKLNNFLSFIVFDPTQPYEECVCCTIWSLSETPSQTVPSIFIQVNGIVQSPDRFIRFLINFLALPMYTKCCDGCDIPVTSSVCHSKQKRNYCSYLCWQIQLFWLCDNVKQRWQKVHSVFIFLILRKRIKYLYYYSCLKTKHDVQWQVFVHLRSCGRMGWAEVDQKFSWFAYLVGKSFKDKSLTQIERKDVQTDNCTNLKTDRQLH